MKCPKCQFENPSGTAYCGKCGTKFEGADGVSFTKTLETASNELTRGTLFAGRYEIIEELGAGGMGRVYRAFDKKIEEEVALKLIRPEIAAEKRTVERFRNEIKTARKITHKNVCRTHDLGEEGKALFITMEYVRRTRILAPGTAVSIARQVAEGLGEAHRLGVVHRDLKPGNIMIDKDGNAKIMDFGIARSQAGKGTTAEGAVIGTPEYMSPEQVEGKPADLRADIYALGIILFEMVTGRPPFDGETSLAIAHKHKYEPAPNPLTLNPQIPVDLGRLILRCLEKEKETRYQTTEEFLADLEGVEEALPTTERTPAGRLFTRRKPATSRTITVKIAPRKLIIPTVAVVAIAIGLGILLPKREPVLSQDGPQSIAVLPFTDLSPDKGQAAWCEGIAETLLNSLANVKSLQVRGRHSSFLFTAKDDPREVGRKLNAGKLLTGSLQMLGNQIRITVQLINTADGAPAWSEQFDGEMEGIFSIQDRIAAMTVSRMKVGLTEAESLRLEKRYTNNKEAYELYLKGIYIERSAAAEAIQKAIPFFLEAIKHDPNFVLPYIMLARDYADLYISFGAVLPRDEAYKKSKEVVNKALALDSENGAACAVLANLNYSFENDLAAAERNFERALRLSPRSLVVLEYHNFFLIQKGRLTEALDEIKFMVEIDPLLPQYYMYLGRQYYYLRRYDDSIAAYAKGLELDPDHANSLIWRNFTFLAQGRIDKILDTLKRLDRVYPGTDAAWRALIEASAGNRREAEKYKYAAKDLFEDLFNSTVYYAAIGDRDQALNHLKRLYNENPGLLSFVFLNHSFDKYRSDPEFVELMRKSGFEFQEAPKN
jgi:serine/threonine protein kinase/tetratricopeptide (TPR) repeat protein